MKLTIHKRDKLTKSATRTIRREGNVPAIIYAKGVVGDSIVVLGSELKAILKGIKPGSLPTTVFEIDFEGKKRRAVVKEIQYAPTTYEVIHLDFIELLEDQPIDIKVPIECVGTLDCVGVKLGGILRQIIRHMKVRCLPKHIPSEFTLDVKNLNITDTLKLSAIDLPSAVRPLVNLNEVAVVVAKR